MTGVSWLLCRKQYKPSDSVLSSYIKHEKLMQVLVSLSFILISVFLSREIKCWTAFIQTIHAVARLPKNLQFAICLCSCIKLDPQFITRNPSWKDIKIKETDFQDHKDKPLSISQVTRFTVKKTVKDFLAKMEMLWWLTSLVVFILMCHITFQQLILNKYLSLLKQEKTKKRN